MRIIVVGVGGNCQTYFMKYLKNNRFKLNSINDIDDLKHVSNPAILEKYKTHKIIYIYNKSFDSICSHYRRKWAIKQMEKIKIKNTCTIKNVNNFFELTELNLIDYFGIKDHFLRYYKYNFTKDIYFLNFSKINKNELATFLKCDKSIFDNLNYDPNKRNNYINIKNKYPLSKIMYDNIDNYINKLSEYKNSNYGTGLPKK
jgi:hypothetical protein